MANERLQQRADRLAARMESLAEALRASAVGDEASAELLARAAAAVVQALGLELLLDEREGSQPFTPARWDTGPRPPESAASPALPGESRAPAGGQTFGVRARYSAAA